MQAQPDPSGLETVAATCLVFITLCFVLLVVCTVYLARISKDMRLLRSLVAAFMEHKVAGTVAENKLASLVQEANKPE